VTWCCAYADISKSGIFGRFISTDGNLLGPAELLLIQNFANGAMGECNNWNGTSVTALQDGTFMLLAYN